MVEGLYILGMLTSCGVRTSERRVGRSLARVAPLYHRRRQQNIARRTNPVPYSADYPGHKLHIDQNEKLVMYGVTHVAAVDGYSGMIVGFVTMPLKNPILIYDQLYRFVITVACLGMYFSEAVASYRCRVIARQFGLWDQLRVDHGREWCLMLHVQERLATQRYNTDRRPFLASSSTQVSYM